ncbi:MULTISPECIES: ABC transporter substrate-binding protein [Arthrobacter]|uniref:Peptide ABC transporter substrate-binding protein n=1 Tax=Arthrobacter psychrochitiniphilus TaxID=291045 RepID=A0A2V3DVU2_9MICC|nr:MULTISPECIES: ABC transporter substrate-binding protein [Arthrobacter]NYG16350.1 peptide/nickel transport system substrate-binding protein [Arthrobacter psychrochitiniphilus]PXA69488.1 peptide ABC transporter substrate-binding protein [Arthrobacter psychrochitiniphilus]
MKAPKRAYRVLALAATAAIFLSGCGGANDKPAANPSEDAVLTLASGVEPQSLDPAMSREAQFVQYFQPVFDTLIRRDSNGDLQPMLATKWDIAKDGKALTLTLREGVKFTDGGDVTAEAVKGNLDRFKAAGGPLAGALGAVESVDVLDPATVKLNLSTPDPALPYALGGPSGYIQSPANFDAATVDTQPVGSGPYELDRSATTPGSQYTFVKNEDYWDKDLVKFAKIVIKPIKDENARFNAVRSGQADGMIATAKTVKAAESAGVTVKMVPGDWQGLTLLDRAGKLSPELGKVEVRQAINYAIDKDAILKNVAQGFGKTTSQVFGPSSSAFVESLDGAYSYDVDKAKALLKEAGLANGFTLKMPTSSDMDPALAPAIKDQLAKVGITVDWVDIPSAQYQPEQQSGTYAAAFTAFGQPVVAWSAVNSMVTENAPWNVFHSSTPETKTLIADVLASDEDAAGAKLAELNKYLVDNAWFAPWYRIDQPYFISKNVTVTVQNGQPVPSIYNFAPAK